MPQKNEIKYEMKQKDKILGNGFIKQKQQKYSVMTYSFICNLIILLAFEHIKHILGDSITILTV